MNIFCQTLKGNQNDYVYPKLQKAYEISIVMGSHQEVNFSNQHKSYN
jgi:hypothetical protein